MAQTPTESSAIVSKFHSWSAGLCIVGSHEAADAVLAAVGADQDFAFDDGGSHRLAVAVFGVGDFLLPEKASGLGVERHELRVERQQIDLVLVDRDAAIVGSAAERGDGPHLVLVVPVLLAGLGIEGVDVAERGGDVHHVAHDDRAGLERLLDFGLEDPRRAQLADVGGRDLLQGRKPGLIVVAVGMQEVLLDPSPHCSASPAMTGVAGAALFSVPTSCLNSCANATVAAVPDMPSGSKSANANLTEVSILLWRHDFLQVSVCAGTIVRATIGSKRRKGEVGKVEIDCSPGAKGNLPSLR